MILLQPVSKIKPAELLAAYLLHGSLGAIPGLIDPANLTYGHFDQHIRDRSGELGGYELFCVDIERKVGGKVRGVELKFRFYESVLYSDSIRSYGEPIRVTEFLDSFFCLASTTDVLAANGFHFETFLYDGSLDEGAMVFGNGRVLRFDSRDNSDFFVVHSIDGDYAQGWESSAEATWTSIRTHLRPLDSITSDTPRVLELKRRTAALKARYVSPSA